MRRNASLRHTRTLGPPLDWHILGPNSFDQTYIQVLAKSACSILRVAPTQSDPYGVLTSSAATGTHAGLAIRATRPALREGDDIVRSLARPVVKSNGLAHPHGQTVALREPVCHFAHGHFNGALAHPYLLMHDELPRSGLICHSRSRREKHIDNLNR